YMCRLIDDAGGENPFAGKKIYGSYSLSPEKILMQASDADVWLIRHNGENITYETLGNDRPLYRKFAPYINHRVFVSDTSTSRIFEDAAFHPYLLLGNLIRILHPDVEIANEKEYFEKLQ
ncbi:MAG: ABC transporter substrate-binding protein, partial [Muribaculaceae bacterium]|nr:ABC transporter substrate-binding protein [Muribaculaceae bacterium]